MTNIVRLSLSPPNSIIPENEVCIQRLASVLDAAVIDYELDDEGHIYANEGLESPVVVSLEHNKKLISFAASAEMDVASSISVFSRCNEANSSIWLVQFCWMPPALWGFYSLPYDGGVDVKHVVKTLRRFAAAFAEGLEICKRAKADLVLKI